MWRTFHNCYFTAQKVHWRCRSVKATVSGMVKKANLMARRFDHANSRSALMSRVRHSGTSLELRVRKELRLMGIKFTTSAGGLAGSPDVANLKDMWVVFVHGCFWHAHKKCGLWKLPSTNKIYWENKFAENKRRDENVKRRLRRRGYRVLVLWGCEVKAGDKMTRKLQEFFSDVYHVRV